MFFVDPLLRSCAPINAGYTGSITPLGVCTFFFRKGKRHGCLEVLCWLGVLKGYSYSYSYRYIPLSGIIIMVGITRVEIFHPQYMVKEPDTGDPKHVLKVC